HRPISFFLRHPATFPENGELGGRHIDSLVLGERDSRRRAPRHKKSARYRRRSRAFGPDSKEPGRLSVEPRWAGHRWRHKNRLGPFPLESLTNSDRGQTFPY